jgi:uncharacterized protein
MPSLTFSCLPRVRTMFTPYSIILVVSSLFYYACDSSNTASDETMIENSLNPMEMNPSNTNSSTRVHLLENLVTYVYLPAIEHAQSQNQFLVNALEMILNEESDDLTLVQETWLQSIQAWHALEFMQVGPAGHSEFRIGGENIRDMIYSFPEKSACRVDQELIKFDWKEDDWIGSAEFNVRGYDAIEHLVFDDPLTNNCPSSAQINRSTSWQDFIIGTNNPLQVRFQYALVLAKDINNHLQSLQQAWSGDFAQAFLNHTAPFKSEQEVLDQVFASLFYIDKWVKDLKLGKPIGLANSLLDNCKAIPCLSFLEHGSSQYAKEALIVNLQSFLWVLQAKSPEEGDVDRVSFLTLLEKQGATELSQDLVEKTQAIIDDLEGLNSDLHTQIANDLESIEDVYSRVHKITDLLKGPFVTILNLNIPEEGMGDND